MKAHADSRETAFCWSSLEYLVPYLKFVRDNKELFAALLANSGALKLDQAYVRTAEQTGCTVNECASLLGAVYPALGRWKQCGPSI